jgi:hypothetical protein
MSFNLDTTFSDPAVVLAQSGGPPITGGFVASSGNSTLTDTAQSWTTNQYTGMYVKIVRGAGSDAGQIAKIASNTATALTIGGTWAVNPSANSVYAIYTNYPAPSSLWSQMNAKPYILVSANGSADGGDYSPSQFAAAIAYQASLASGNAAGYVPAIYITASAMITISGTFTINVPYAAIISDLDFNGGGDYSLGHFSITIDYSANNCGKIRLVGLPIGTLLFSGGGNTFTCQGGTIDNCVIGTISTVNSAATGPTVWHITRTYIVPTKNIAAGACAGFLLGTSAEFIIGEITFAYTVPSSNNNLVISLFKLTSATGQSFPIFEIGVILISGTVTTSTGVIVYLFDIQTASSNTAGMFILRAVIAAIRWEDTSSNVAHTWTLVNFPALQGTTTCGICAIMCPSIIVQIDSHVTLTLYNITNTAWAGSDNEIWFVGEVILGTAADTLVTLGTIPAAGSSVPRIYRTRMSHPGVYANKSNLAPVLASTATAYRNTYTMPMQIVVVTAANSNFVIQATDEYGNGQGGNPAIPVGGTVLLYPGWTTAPTYTGAVSWYWRGID